MSAAVKIRASWLEQAGKRLDASYYGGPGQREAKAFIASGIEKKALRELTEGGEAGIYIPSRFKRNYVDNPNYGYPYLTGASIVQSDPLINCKYLSRKYTKNLDKLSFKPDTIVITCSGNIGNAIYVTEYFNGAIGSPDLVRIIPDKNKILPGYLFAFLSSSIGQALIKQSTYGSVVQHIEAHHVYDLPIPMIDVKEMRRIHQLIDKAQNIRTEANNQLLSLQNKLSEKLHALIGTDKKEFSYPLSKSFNQSFLWQYEKRLDGAFYASTGRFVHDQIKKTKHINIGTIAKVYHPVIFGKKKLRGTESKGVPLYNSSSMMKLIPETNFILSLKKRDKYEKLRVQDGWILVSRTGTVGNIARISTHWNGIFIDDHMIRIIPQKGYSGLIYIFLSTELGKSLAIFQKYGSVQDVLKDFLIERIPIPEILLEQSFVKNLDEKVKDAFNKFDQALLLEKEAISTLEQELSEWLD